MLLACVAACLSAGATPAFAEEAPDEAPAPPNLVEAGLAWKRAPALYDMARLYPIRAKTLGIRRGEAVLDCAPRANGRLACVVVEEHPSETYFGDAALKVMNPVTVAAADGGSPEGRTFRFALKFGFWPPDLLPDYVKLDAYGLRWARMPHVMQYWRGAGLPKGESFKVEVACTADARGAPICTVTDDAHASQGYARGVVKALSKAKVETLDGSPVEGKTFAYSLTMTAD